MDENQNDVIDGVHDCDKCTYVGNLHHISV